MFSRERPPSNKYSISHAAVRRRSRGDGPHGKTGGRGTVFFPERRRRGAGRRRPSPKTDDDPAVRGETIARNDFETDATGNGRPTAGDSRAPPTFRGRAVNVEKHPVRRKADESRRRRDGISPGVGSSWLSLCQCRRLVVKSLFA